MGPARLLAIRFRSCIDIEHQSGLKCQCYFNDSLSIRGVFKCSLTLRERGSMEGVFKDCPFSDGRDLVISPMKETKDAIKIH